MKKETYESFVEKFKPKKTTDDCLTPPIVYDAIAGWVAAEYGVNRENFVRPFYPGGDYQSEDYTEKYVVDNPPFSLLAQILDYYNEHDVKFFLFVPTLTCFGYCNRDFVTVLPVDYSITYHNGAKINTSFITNMDDPEIRVRGVPSLHQAIITADNLNRKSKPVERPKYKYPDNVLTATRAARKHAAYAIPKSESVFVRRLDSQIPEGKSICGSGLLISAQCEAAIQETTVQEARVWALSDRELEILHSLSERR